MSRYTFFNTLHRYSINYLNIYIVGDSGGSLYYNSGRQYTVGIVSYGPACGTNRPSANTKIYPYLNWISGITSDGLCDK